MTTPLPGAPIHLMDWLNTMHVFGVVSDGEVPGLRTCTFEGVNNDIVATVPVLKGDPGEPGLPSPVVDLHIDPTITTPTQLPTDLGLDDKGKTWWIGVCSMCGWVPNTSRAQRDTPDAPAPRRRCRSVSN
ncbi:Bacteriophage minor tail subunit [Mycobacteroides abscessus]|nr:Bacteriophage minor tail subunit [Mycobacteroides abscessus]